MTRYLVTRHSGTVAFAESLGLAPFVAVEHFDAAALDRLLPLDEVYGTLPYDLAADVVARGVLFYALIVRTARAERGRELATDDLAASGACFRRFEVTAPGARSDGAAPRAANWARSVSRRFFLFSAFVTAIVIVQNLFALAVFDVIKLVQGEESPIRGAELFWDISACFGVLSVFCATGVFAFCLRHGLVRCRAIPRDRPDPCSALIVGLSDIDPRSPLTRAAIERQLEALASLPLSVLMLSQPEFQQRRGALSDAQIAAFESMSPLGWQRIFRAAALHLPRLRRLLVVTSEQSDKDFDRFHKIAARTLRKAGYDVDVINATPGGINFERYQDISVALRRATELAAALSGRGHNVCIDVTGGSKVFSIAGAIAALNRRIPLTYMNPKGQPIAYDTSIEIFSLQD